MGLSCKFSLKPSHWFTVDVFSVGNGHQMQRSKTKLGGAIRCGRWGSDGTTWCFGQDVQLACCTTQIWTSHSISFIFIHCHSMSPVSMLSICNHSPGLRCLECLDSGILSRMSQGCLDSEWLRMTQTHWSWEVHLKSWMCQIYVLNLAARFDVSNGDRWARVFPGHSLP